MNRLSLLFGVAAVGAAALAPQACAEPPQHCKLELVRLEPMCAGVMPADFRYYQVNPQRLLWPNAGDSPAFVATSDFGNDASAHFKDLVKKEPKKYVAEHPLRGLAKLGSKEYGFVLDQKGKKSKGYDRLYFDLHGDGDLADAKPIDAETPAGPRGIAAGYAQTMFPRVDLAVDLGGKKLDYSFFFQVVAYGSAPHWTVVASLTSAVYRRGEVVLEGKKWKVIVLDANSNGRFDDVTSYTENVRDSEGRIYATPGDVLWIEDAQVPAGASRAPAAASPTRIPLCKVNTLGGKAYELKVSPSGDELTCGPSALPMGKVTSPQAPCTVELGGDVGVVSLTLEKSRPVEIPAGRWRLLSYTVTVRDWKEPSKQKATKSGGPSLADALAKALLSTLFGNPEPMYGPAGVCTVSAQGTKEGKPLRVEAGKTTTLGFGPPYKPRVTVTLANETAYLGLAIIGAEGEVVSNLVLNGRRPDKPKVTITGAKDKVVAQGNFEYG